MTWRWSILSPTLQREGHRGIGLDRADAVDAGDRGDDDDVVALQQRAGRGVAHAVDLLVDRGFLLDIGVGARDVGLGLVIVVVGDEILDRVVGEEALELAVELRRQRLVGGEDQRRPLRRLDHLGHGEGLARAGDAEQHLVALVRRRRPRPARRSPAAGRPWARIPRRAGTAGRLPTSPAAPAGAASTAGRSRMLGSPCSSSAFSDSTVAVAPVRPRGCGSATGAKRACGASPKPLAACRSAPD